MYMKSKFLIMQAAGLYRNDATANMGQTWEQGQQYQKQTMEQDAEQPQQHQSLLNHWLKAAVGELITGNYSEAMIHINEGMAESNGRHDELMGLLELKNIVARLRLKCENPNELIGPTSKSAALPYSFNVHMLDVVQKVLRCRNHYEVLRISHHATYSEVKRAYKRLALRLHPDKNRAPGADIAFRRINEAADTLTDNQRRIEYNLLTSMGDCFAVKKCLYNGGRDTMDQQENELPNDGTLETKQSPGTEVEKNEEKNQLPRRSYQPANQRVPHVHTQYQTEQLIISLVAGFVFVLITLHYFTTPLVYSFTPTNSHNVRLVSRYTRVPFYVTPEVAEGQTTTQLRRLEQEIEEIYITELKHNCKHERMLRAKLLQRAHNINNAKLQEHAIQMSTPSCQALARLEHLKYQPLQLIQDDDEISCD